jgi:hypothetical protein
VVGEDLGPPSLRGMAGAELMGREGRSCHMRKEGIRVRTDVNSLFFLWERRYNGVCDGAGWTAGRVGEERRFWACGKTHIGSFLANAMVGAMMAPKLKVRCSNITEHEPYYRADLRS